MSADWRMEIMDSIQNQVNIIKSFHKTHQRIWKYNPCSHMHILARFKQYFCNNVVKYFGDSMIATEEADLVRLIET